MDEVLKEETGGANCLARLNIVTSLTVEVARRYLLRGVSIDPKTITSSNLRISAMDWHFDPSGTWLADLRSLAGASLTPVSFESRYH